LARFAPGTPDRERHVQDDEDFLRASDTGTLLQVAFYQTTGDLNEHLGEPTGAGTRHTIVPE
jgi:hypothetical protein